MSKIVNCKTCGAQIASTAKTCPSCGAKNKRPIYRRVWFWILIIFVAFIILGSILEGIYGSGGEVPAQGNSNATAINNQTVPSVDTDFSGDCGISASATMESSIINYPELKISIKNTTKKDIAAIRFYAVPFDVYGDEIKGWTTQKYLYTDTAIRAGASNKITFQFIEDSVKTVKLYVYSVYFSDGTEWGNKDASDSTILKNGTLINVSGES